MAEKKESNIIELPVAKEEKTILHLSVTERINFIRYVQLLPCTWRVRVDYERILRTFSPTEEERTKAGITFDEHNDPVAKADFYVDIDAGDIPDSIRDVAVKYLEQLEQSRLTEHGDSLHKLYHNWCISVGKVIGYEEVPDPKRTDIKY